jgi:hypothetical protein
MPKPNYASLFADIALTAPGSPERAALEAIVYNFTPPIPLPEGETVDDYLLNKTEQEFFAYMADDYIIDNPGYVSPAGQVTIAYTFPDYVVNGYINIEYPDSGLYAIVDYVQDGYLELTDTSISSGFSSYVGEYYNDLGETT